MPTGLLDFAASEEVTAAKMDSLAKQAVVDCTNAAKPTLNEGGHIAVTDTDRLEVYDGSAWQRISHYAAAGRTGGRWTRVANQSISNSTTTPISWDTEAADSDSFLTEHATTGTTITIPAGLGGLYAISATVIGGTDPRPFWVAIECSTGDVAASSMDGSITKAAYSWGVSWIGALAAADTFQVNVRQSSGGSINFTGRLHVHRLAI